MERTPVESSQLASRGYDAEKQILEIEFKGGGIYQYFDFPPEKFKEFTEAESAGRYFGQNIRGKFTFKKLPPPEKPAEEASAT